MTAVASASESHAGCCLNSVYRPFRSPAATMQRSLRLYLPLSSLLLLLLPLMGLLALTAATRSAAGSRSRHRRLVRQRGVLLDGSAAADGTVREHACPSDAKQDAQPCLQALIDRMHAVPTDPAILRRHPNPSCLIVLPAGAEYLINAPLRVNQSKAISIVASSEVGANIVANASMAWGRSQHGHCLPIASSRHRALRQCIAAASGARPLHRAASPPQRQCTELASSSTSSSLPSATGTAQ